MGAHIPKMSIETHTTDTGNTRQAVIAGFSGPTKFENYRSTTTDGDDSLIALRDRSALT